MTEQITADLKQDDSGFNRPTPLPMSFQTNRGYRMALAKYGLVAASSQRPHCFRTEGDHPRPAML